MVGDALSQYYTQRQALSAIGLGQAWSGNAPQTQSYEPPKESQPEPNKLLLLEE